MTIGTKLFDNSNELHLYRWGNGVKLIDPRKINNFKYSHQAHDTGNTIGDIFKLPLSVFLFNLEGVTQNVNEHDAELCGFNSVREAIGKNGFDILTKETAELTRINDLAVMKFHRLTIVEEELVLSKNDLKSHTLSIKRPWYDNKNNVIGVFGCSIVFGKHPIAESLSLIAKTGLLNVEQNTTKILPGLEINNKYFSKRELECLRLTIRGKTAKQVAFEMLISRRTVEEYLDNIKAKMGVFSKPELIDRAISYLNQYK